jgi:neurotransmitter:Na+ symporter, NSS family
MSSRGNFSGQLGFILAAAGSAVGLSNIWRFPYLAGQNGGAVFLIIYIVCVLLLCFPVMVGEIAIGRAARRDAYGSYSTLGNKKWGLVGLLGIVTGIIILSYYNVVAAWAFGYFVEIVFGSLLSSEDFRAFFGSFVNHVDRIFVYSAIFMVMTAVCVVGGIQKGIERANKILMPALFLILVGLIVYSLALPRAGNGVRFYLVPDFGEITPQTIFEALKVSFFSLSLGVGGLMTYGSYMKKNENIIGSSAVVAGMDTLVASLAGLMVFPLVFSAGKSPAEGPALVFIVMPEIFKGMFPLVGKIIGGAFFVLLCFAALTSTISLMELPVAYLVDEKKMQRRRVVWILALAIFVLGLPSMVSFGAVPALSNLSFYKDKEFLTLMADITDISLTTGGCLMCIFIRQRWKIVNLNNELSAGNEKYTRSFAKAYVNFSIMYVCPILLAILTGLIILDKLFGLFALST